MLKSQIYIVQLVGVILLLCGYLLSDQPDSLSVMHFNNSSDCQYVFKKARKPIDKSLSGETCSSTDRHPGRRTSVPKFISYEVVLPVVHTYAYHPYTEVNYAFPLQENYAYLFFEEINPPPPKSC